MTRGTLAAALPTVAVLAIAALPRGWAAVADQGLFWPDELYQSLEPAHHLVFGYGVRVWEFIEGARSWLFPGALAAVLWLLASVGFGTGPGLVVGAKLAMAGVSLLGVYGALCLGRRLAGNAGGWLAGLFAAAFPAALLFGSRCSAEMASGTLLVFAAVALVRRGPRDALLAGALAGLAVFLRYPNGIVVLGCLAWLAVARPRSELRDFALGAVGVGWLGGLLDWATWGAPFHSLRVFVDYNLAFQEELYGAEGAFYYATTLWTATGAVLLAPAIGLLFALRHWPGLGAVALAYVLAHSAVGHKELRFLLPVLPLLLALAGAGLAHAIAPLRFSPRVLGLAGVALAAAMAQRAATLTFAAAGQYVGEPAGAVSPWHSGGGVNRLLWLAGAQADLCGVWVTGLREVWSGGYAHLHRRVPLLKDADPANAARANYAIAPAEPIPFPLAWDPPAPLHPAFVPVAQSREWLLFRRDGPCAAVRP